MKLTYQLACNESNSLDTEPKMAANKVFVKRLTKIINSHCIETGFGTEPMDTRDASSAAKLLINTKFMFYGMLFSIHGLEFDNDILPRQDVMRKVYFAYGFIIQIQEV